ncbi:hypothetical protein ES703_19177 [subsurface metagenome]
MLFAGLILIAYTVYSSFNIFIAKAAPPELFKTEEQAPSRSLIEGQGIEGQIQEMIGEQLKDILPVDSLPILLNLIAWSVFAGILIFAGAQISSLGIKLIK